MKKGIIYIAVNKSKKRNDNHTIRNQYKPAVISAKSVKKHMSYLDITLFTNLDIDKFDDAFDNVIKVEDHELTHSIWQKKWEYLKMSPYDISLHLDADTYVCEGFSEIFPLMDHFDMAIPFSPHYYSRKISVPKSFPELAGGVILWKRTKRQKNS